MKCTQYTLLAAVITLVVAGLAAFAFYTPEQAEALPIPVSRQEVQNAGEQDAVANESRDEQEVETADAEVRDTLPEAINLAVPFTSQAPHANWDLPYQEACEEASVLMAVDFVSPASVDLSSLSAADREIVNLVEFATNEQGLAIDTTIEETRQFAAARYPDLAFRTIANPTVDDLKSELAAGNPVIVPAAGRQLGNPNFSGAGPLYHMFVLRGYTATGFITNDPGTRNGEAYVYSYETIMRAMGDWNSGDPANGQKIVLVVEA